MFDVAQKYKMFGGNKQSLQQLDKFANNYNLLKQILEQLDQKTSDAKSEQQSVSEKVQRINELLEDLAQTGDVIFADNLLSSHTRVHSRASDPKLTYGDAKVSKRSKRKSYSHHTVKAGFKRFARRTLRRKRSQTLRVGNEAKLVNRPKVQDIFARPPVHSDSRNLVGPFHAEQNFKLLVIGDSGVGKSSLIAGYVDHCVPEPSITTIGVDTKETTIEVSGVKVTLEIWDTAGQERYKTASSAYIKNANGIIIVFDITNQLSFDNVTKWLEEISKVGRQPCILLLGNKLDLSSSRKVPYQKSKELADQYNLMYSEVSSKDFCNQHGEEVILGLVKSMLENVEKVTE